MKARVLIIKDYRGFIHQHLSTAVSLDCDEIVSGLRQQAIEVEETAYNEIVSSGRLWAIENEWIFYTSSQIPEYRLYCDSILYPLHQRNRLLPKYELFRCHEDKICQEIYASRLGLHRPESFIIATSSDLQRNSDLLHFPMIAKLPSGFGSSGVFLVRDIGEILSLGDRLYNRHRTVMKRLKRRIKRLVPFLYSYSHSENNQQERFVGRMLLQEYVPGLTHDWKVLLFGDHIYTLERSARSGDFRASGSGHFQFVDPPESVLSFAQECFHALDTPFASLDIAVSSDAIYLLEFQATHFGPFAQLRANYYYERSSSGDWLKREKTSSLEKEYAYAIATYISRKS